MRFITCVLFFCGFYFVNVNSRLSKNLSIAILTSRLTDHEVTSTCQKEDYRSSEENSDSLFNDLLYLDDPENSFDKLEHLDRVEKLRKLIEDYKKEYDYFETRTDYDYLIKFLRATNYKVEAALDKLKHYVGFMSEHLKWREANADKLSLAYSSGSINILKQRDSKGRRLIWIRISNWEPSMMTLEDILQSAVIGGEIGALESSTQRAGIILLFDFKDFSYSYIRYFTPGFVTRLIFYLSKCLPFKISQVHFINQPTVFSVLYFTLFKPFLTGHASSIIFLHSDDLRSLHTRVHPSVLPVELGGHQKHDPKMFEGLSTDQIIIDALVKLKNTVVINKELAQPEKN